MMLKLNPNGFPLPTSDEKNPVVLSAESMQHMARFFFVILVPIAVGKALGC